MYHVKITTSEGNSTVVYITYYKSPKLWGERVIFIFLTAGPVKIYKGPVKLCSTGQVD